MYTYVMLNSNLSPLAKPIPTHIVMRVETKPVCAETVSVRMC